MARGTQHRKRRPTQNARAGTAAAVTAAAPKRRKRKPPEWQEQLFFQRLRVHAKFIFLLLAVVFALSFVFLGVGSGSSGISQALQSFFSSNGSSGSSISKLEKKTQKNPLNAQAWRDLATAYETKQRTADAIGALTQYVGLKPKDTGALTELGAQYTQQANQYATDYQNAHTQVAAATPAGQAFVPSTTTPLGKAYTDTTALKDPISAALQTAANTNQSTAYSNYQQAQSSAESTYQKLAKLTPDDANAQLELGQAAAGAQDYKVAIAAYDKFLVLAPHDPLASQVKAQLKTLKAESALGSLNTTSK